MVVGYVDLNVQHQSRVTQAELQRLGYRFVGVNVDCANGKAQKPIPVHEVKDLPVNVASALSTSKKKAKQYSSIITSALEINKSNKKLTQLRRLTIKIEDIAMAQSFGSSPHCKAYDLIAVEAANAKVFQYLCEQAEYVDLITFDVANRLPLAIKRPWLQKAMQRGIYFEICYAPCLGDSAGRRYFFSNTSNLIRLTNGKHLVFSSSASRDLVLRSPYDVINIGILCGLTYGQAHDAIAASCHAVMREAGTRTHNVYDAGS